MAWTTTPYTTLADVKALLDLSNTTDDAWLDSLIVAAQDAVDTFVGYPFQQDGTLAAPATRTYDGTDGPQLWIHDTLSVSQVLETTYNAYMGSNGVYTSGTAQTVDITADCFLQPNNSTPKYLLARITGLPFSAGRQNYVVKGVFGQPAVPASISRATGLLVVHYFKRRDAAYMEATAKKAGPNYGPHHYGDTDLPGEVCAILERYRRRLFLSAGR